MSGWFAGKLVLIDAQDDVSIAFRGSKAMPCVRAPWVGDFSFDPEHVYARSRSLGPVRINVGSLKTLAARLGEAFVRVEQGVFVNVVSYPLVVDKPGKLIGVVLGRDRSCEPMIEWVVASRMGLRAIQASLKLAPAPTSDSPVSTG